MQLCLTHPQYGYYTSHDPLGAQGDFTTAPEISQIFGELTGLWLASQWLEAGSPSPCTLLELGAGRGTLMNDILRATKRIPGFHDAIHLHILECSPVLIQKQQEILAGWPVSKQWITALDALPDAPLFFIANEFFDALPIRQFRRNEDTWQECYIALNHDNTLTLDFQPLPPSFQRRLESRAASSKASALDPSLPSSLRYAETGRWDDEESCWDEEESYQDRGK